MAAHWNAKMAEHEELVTIKHDKQYKQIGKVSYLLDASKPKREELRCPSPSGLLPLNHAGPVAAAPLQPLPLPL
jgi:hypothetical protein